MDKRRRRTVLVILLALTVGNFFRIQGHEVVRPVLFLSVFVMGALSGMLIMELRNKASDRKADVDKMV